MWGNRLLIFQTLSHIRSIVDARQNFCVNLVNSQIAHAHFSAVAFAFSTLYFAFVSPLEYFFAILLFVYLVFLLI